MSPTNAQSFNKTFDMNNRSYNVKLKLETHTSILFFNVIDRTDFQNPQNFCNNFSLNQEDNAQN